MISKVSLDVRNKKAKTINTVMCVFVLNSSYNHYSRNSLTYKMSVQFLALGGKPEFVRQVLFARRFHFSFIFTKDISHTCI